MSDNHNLPADDDLGSHLNPLDTPLNLDLPPDPEEVGAAAVTDTAPADPAFDDQDTDEPLDDTEALSNALADAIAPAVADAQATGRIPQKWDIPDYLATGNDSGAAKKLASSAVAPLVAMARGYETVHEESLKDAYMKYPLPRKSTAQGRRLSEAVQRGDLLIMPWFTHDDVVDAEKSMKQPKPATVQIRPARPEVVVSPSGKERELKYEFVSGLGTPIGMHPAFPTSWIDNTPVVLIAEGLLKADSALTGYLLANGCTRDDLSWTSKDSTGDHSADVKAARSRLAFLLDRISPDNQVLVLSIGGVDNWKNNPEWRSIRLNDRQAWIGIDGDVATNPNVYRAASELWDFLKEKKKATPVLLAPTVPVPDGGESKKVGIDDYLADYGDWLGLLAQRADKLPKRPDGTDVEFIGTYRISPEGTCLEFCKPVPDPFNPDAAPVKGVWEEVLPIGGRIVSTVTRRLPTAEEIETGVMGAGFDASEVDGEVEIELKWRDPNDPETVHTETISAPANILNYTPDLWDRHKARIPMGLLRSPFWPPSKKDGEEWLRAMKAHMMAEARERTRWATMGWVPVENNVPAFIIGNQVIGATDAPDADIFPGVGETELRGSSLFGVGEEDPRDFGDESYHADVRDAIERLLETFMLSGAWTDRKVASTVIAAGLRPALPLRPKATVFCVGPPRKGKSFTASAIMSFWAAKKGAFRSSLPGSAKDTATAMELAVARSAIWVADDLAPATSRQQSEKEQDKIANLVRDVYNGAAKRRSDQNMGTRQVYSPRALLIVTAENELTVSSARDRCVHINIGYGSLNASREPTDRVDVLAHDDGIPAVVTQALIKYIRYRAKSRGTGGWAEVYAEVDDSLDGVRSSATKRMTNHGATQGDNKRHADSAGDMAVSLVWLRHLAEHVGVREDILALLSESEMVTDVIDLVSKGHRESGSVSPGKALIEAIAMVLSSKKAHIVNALLPAQPPGDESIAANLGWELLGDGMARPKGETIGWYVTDDDHGEIVYIDQKVAFEVAARAYPSLIPHGQGYRSSWASVVGEKYVLEEKCRVGAGGKRLSTARRRDAKVAREITGTPIRLVTLLARGEQYNEDNRDMDY